MKHLKESGTKRRTTESEKRKNPLRNVRKQERQRDRLRKKNQIKRKKIIKKREIWIWINWIN